jgi:hypothetical protein
LLHWYTYSFCPVGSKIFILSVVLTG